MYVGVFYKDKDGFDILCRDPDDRMLVAFATIRAKELMQERKNQINAILFPELTYTTTGTFFKKKVMNPLPQLNESLRTNLERELKTLFIKNVKIV